MFGMFEVLYGYLTRMLGSRNDAASSSGSLHAKATDIKNGVNSLLGRTTFPAVKSVQRGSAYTSTSSRYTTVSISSVNTSKSIVLITFSGELHSSRPPDYADWIYAAGMISASLSSSSITFKRGHDITSGPTIEWQVIEFY